MLLAYDDLPNQPGQRHQPGQRVRDHRPGLHHGVRYRQNAQLRPRRRDYGGRVHLLLYHQLSGPARLAQRDFRHCGMYRPGRGDRGAGL